MNMDKAIIVIFCLFYFGQAAHSQNSKNLESKALEYFFENRGKIDTDLINAKISNNMTTVGRPTRIFILANAIGEINLMKDSIPNKNYLDSLEKAYGNTPSLNSPISLTFTAPIRHHGNGIKLKLWVYNAIEYKKTKYVELLYYLIKKQASI